MSVILSDALPIQFWPIGDDTFNESVYGFVDHRCFFQEFSGGDVIKLQLGQLTNSEASDNTYVLALVDQNNKELARIGSTDNVYSGVNCVDFEFQMDTINDYYGNPIRDKYVRFYILENPDTFDTTFDLTFHGESAIYKSDLIKFSTVITENQSWGTKVLNYKSTRNFAGIYYPVLDNLYYSLRIPCRFFHQRNQSEQNSIPLSNSKVINTSTYRKRQQSLETWYLPDYMLNKIELILDHAVTGDLLIDSVRWTVDEAFERSSPDPRFAYQRGSIWLSQQNYTVRNVI